ncbi:hypothetical protein Atai01_15850 [Amycolatopsis taiwanensis]|uniref:DUF222 domain-containing protein n=1 Tax=Amycolatopsis taiwanensis TaxID=342230 RepID=A0A9W6QY74_9PSEU|nr:hypothetical protein Atai01_15850 [Amycolatopsis taiwanensis]
MPTSCPTWHWVNTKDYPGVLAQVYVHVPIDAALGITNTGCELEGHGPIPSEIARQIMADPNSVWRKITCDPASGAVLDVGRTRYRPPAALDELIRVRDRTCRAPGCHRPAQRSDIDHHHDYHRGKTATPPNTTSTAYADDTTA